MGKEESRENGIVLPSSISFLIRRKNVVVWVSGSRWTPLNQNVGCYWHVSFLRCQLATLANGGHHRAVLCIVKDREVKSISFYRVPKPRNPNIVTLLFCNSLLRRIQKKGQIFNLNATLRRFHRRSPSSRRNSVRLLFSARVVCVASPLLVQPCLRLSLFARASCSTAPCRRLRWCSFPLLVLRRSIPTACISIFGCAFSSLFDLPSSLSLQVSISNITPRADNSRIKNAENLAIPSVRNDAAFLFTVVGTTGFLGLLAGQLLGVALSYKDGRLWKERVPEGK
ncbi:hypothetical protein PIB30_080932 [Stylosanthes scabra]|uniref:Transmembrane protein n=1 Tax=Stylosanthes scabra TaxID=79078 RepID=A0ABU6RRW1_9FABA|nr:hypothetical protein [Stylosanthes scabra]